jgi:hypothetical protein
MNVIQAIKIFFNFKYYALLGVRVTVVCKFGRTWAKLLTVTDMMTGRKFEVTSLQT